MSEDRAPVLVTGATGYVGGRLVPALLERGHRVRAAGRSVAKIKARPWGGHPGLEAVRADLLDPSSMLEAARGCSAAYYLVHSMRPDVPDFAARDREAACNMARAASQAGMKRIIYLGGLGEDSPELSPHLRSRAEVGRILSLGSAELTVLRAAVILGSGSASFEIIRYLADRLPVIIAPRWVRTRCQPIAVSNVLGYLVGCLENPATAGRSFDIGGPDILTYAEMLRIYAEKAGLRPRLIIPAPLLTPGMSAFWINLVTPVPMSLIRPLVQGLKNEVVCRENDIRRLVPQRLLSCGEAMAQALDKVRQQSVSTCCFDAGSACLPGWAACQDPPYAGGAVHQCNYSARLRGPAERVWRPIQGLGGESGWFFGSFLWRLRGLADELIGGPGLRRGRRHPEDLRVGDALDFWRVLDVRPGKRLLLLAEMKLPGEAMLEIRVRPLNAGDSELRIVSRFLPRGLWGSLYWFALYPFHALIFKNLIQGLARAADAPLVEPPQKIGPQPVVEAQNTNGRGRK